MCVCVCVCVCVSDSGVCVCVCVCLTAQLVGFSVPRLGTEAMYIFKTENNTRGTSSVGKTGHLQCKGSGFSPRSGN